MEMARISREEITRRLRKTLGEEKPIIGVGCSCGLFAKCAELGGVDLIIVYSTGLSRLKGLPTWIIGDSNEITLRMIEEIANVVQDTPIIAGVEGCDPTRKMDKYLEKVIAAGCSGIINFPTLALCERSEYWRKSKEDVGWGVGREVEMIRLAHAMGLFTLCYVRFNDDAVDMVRAGADMVCVHGGRTAGGLVGRKDAPPLAENVQQVNALAKAVREVSPEVFIVQHGGSVATPEDTTYIYQNSDAMGYIGASSFERIPIEQALIQAAKDYKSKNIRRNR
jgi:predicted TIM-barrel enzyme